MPRRRNPSPPVQEAERVIIPVCTPGVQVEVIYVGELPPAVAAARRWFAQRVWAELARQRVREPQPAPASGAAAAGETAGARDLAGGNHAITQEKA